MSRVTHMGLSRKFEDVDTRRRDESGKLAPLPALAKKVGECKVAVCVMSSRDIIGAPGQFLRTNAHKKCLKNAGIREKRLDIKPVEPSQKEKTI